MSSTSLQPPLRLPVPQTIAPHLLHSPAHSPADSLQRFMDLDPYREVTSQSPQSLCYPSPPDTNSRHSGLQSATAPGSIASPCGMLVVHSYGPVSAPSGSVLTAQVDFTNISGTNVRLRIVFGDLALPTSVAPNVAFPQRAVGQERGDWKLEIKVPPVGQASDHMAEIRPDGRLEWPLTLQALDASGNLLDTIGFGLFAYENLTVLSKEPPPSLPYEYKPRPRSPNKRSHEDSDGDYSPLTPTKRLSMDTEVMHIRRISDDYVDGSFVRPKQSPTAHRTFLNHPSSASAQSILPSIAIPPHTFQHHQGPMHTRLQTQSGSQHLPGVFAVPSSPGAHSDDSPALVRTSQLGHDAKPEQASVAIQGELEAMKHEWVEGEYAAGRRLVQFWKRQVGTTLHISFGAIPQSEYKENTIVVSCIYRDNVDDYFITSVDVIYLLEALAGNRFEVEEKNRIRRNLEGFKPMTVSKSKPGTEEFFRIIMELPPPRPRNIEKDVKVFEWGKLRGMLEKVFSKYSTVPYTPTTPSPQYDGSVHGASSMMYSFSKTGRGSSTEPPLIPIPPATLPSMSQKRRSPVPSARLRDIPTLPPLHTSNQNQGAHYVYTEQFQPSRFNDHDRGLPSGEYACSSNTQLFGVPLEIENVQTLSKAETGLMNGHVGVPAITGRQHEGFKSGSPLSCNNSPLSMTLSVSSRTSSEGGHLENQDLTAVPVVTGAELLQRSPQQL